ncbi:MAG: DNA cytosine methyltransferase [Clostridium sp.]|nr:DNA cytosine methyltransferase [Clostridium sp.]MCM1400235.1 DNA cytosine methyltransferase [Clostridium sp.]MCM1460948.1 DNA cytosine methyltransferase [Bacteroides sp.]
MINGELIIDNFAGGGGASTGIEMATGISVDIAINHDPEAIRLHKTNHPNTKHYCESVWDVDPIKVCKGHPVALAWFSPDCKHFSKAKGGKPKDKSIRGLAWVALRWAALVRPRVIMLENVEEFKTWGPLNRRHHPIKEKKGQTFHKFCGQLKDLGYTVEFKELVAADYGAPTSRKRLFMVARCDGKPIIFPEPTHAPMDSKAVQEGHLQPYQGAYTKIDFTKPCPSIFDTAEEIKEKYGIKAVRPLAPKTMERIASGLKKFVIDNENPFIVQVNHSGSDWNYCKGMNAPLPVITSKNGFGIVEPYIVQIGQTGFSADRSKDVRAPLTTIVGKNEHCLVETRLAPFIMCNNTGNNGAGVNAALPTITTGNRNFVVAPTLIQYHTSGQPRGQVVDKPIMTIDGSNRYGLVMSFLSKFYKTGVGQDIREPLHTITTSAGHFGEVRAFLIKYYGEGTGQDIRAPLDTVTTKDRFGLVTVNGVDYQIVDIGLRMLEPRELYGCQSFPDDYIIDRDYTGKQYSRTEQVKKCGNSVPPKMAEVLVRVNLPELCQRKRMPNMQIQAEETGQLRFA